MKISIINRALKVYFTMGKNFRTWLSFIFLLLFLLILRTIVGFFMIPDHRGSNKQDVPKFPTGARELLVTSNTKNEKGVVFSFAKDTYTAIGSSEIYGLQKKGSWLFYFTGLFCLFPSLV